MASLATIVEKLNSNLKPLVRLMCILQLVPTASSGQIVINEILPDPTPALGLPEHEFIELLNTSPDTIDLQYFNYSDASKTVILPEYNLAPGSYLILCDEDDTALFKPFGNTVGLSTWPSLNNSGDELTLSDTTGIIHRVDYKYSWYDHAIKEEGGWSLEMIDPTNICGGKTNWGASVASIGGTPGQANSIKATNPDEESPELLAATPLTPDTILLQFSEPVEQIASVRVQPFKTAELVRVGDSILIVLDEAMLARVVYTLEINDAQDCAGNLGSGTIRTGLPEPAGRNEVVINEILFDPPAGGSDFVELYNRSSKILSLSSFILANRDDRGSLDQVEWVNSDRLLFPGEYVCLTEDPDWTILNYATVALHNMVLADLPTMPNDGGTLVLSDHATICLDEIRYNSEQHFELLPFQEGVSLERIDPDRPSTTDNWHSASSTCGYATPGLENSHFAPGVFDDKFLLDPSTFTPNNDGVDDAALLYYSLDEIGWSATVTILDMHGRVVDELMRGDLLGTTGLIKWDGTKAGAIQLHTAPYIFHVELLHINGKRKVIRKVCVLDQG